MGKNMKDFILKCEDALAFSKNLSDNSIKLIITSPPYNIGKSYEKRTSISQYIKNFFPTLKELVRVLKDDGSICWQVGNYVENGEVYPLDIFFYNCFKELGLKLRNRIIWHFGHGLHCQKRFSGRYETILWFSKTDNYTFNLDNVRIPSKYPSKRHFKGEKKGQLSGNPKGKNPEDVWELTLNKLYDDWEKEIWEIPNVKANHPEKLEHPCQYPVELAERLVIALSNENDIIYDPFAGVASTIIAGLKNDRIAYGTDLSDKYIHIGLDRIQKLKNNELLLRPIYKEVYKPLPNNKLAQIPSEWLAL